MGVVCGGSSLGSPRSSPWKSPRSGGQWVVHGARVSLFNSNRKASFLRLLSARVGFVPFAMFYKKLSAFGN